ncbi:glycosyltransferase [Lysinibacillus sp. 1 U-2021]|uniref:glycosyltransferase family 2 protein n=1 Tax=unclassified Lysinibacillus TaxID=2636778 RepID=UPI001EDAC6CB|nr:MULTISPECIES: glycosyltransferase [unclassified Lysinibacillus]UKJ44629.1 glycosyltransferase [Lysinibacillus sp. ACHW1.5]WGT39330.1 glycosyltransferase [Lysinibacillus sp. 1 U-2021]
MKIIDYCMLFFGGIILFYMLFVIVSYCTMFIIAMLDLRKRYRLDLSEYDDAHIDALYSKPVSLLVPAYNEEVGVVDTVYSLLNLRYPQTEIIIINDGSTDKTLQTVIEHFQMKPINKIVRTNIPTKDIKQIYESEIYKNCILVDKENGGKADALNVGINVSQYPYFCSIDGDSILDEKSLLRVMKPIILSDGEVIAAGGNIRIANGAKMQFGSIYETQLPSNYLVIMQVIEYFRAFLMGRIALSKFNLVLIISGAFSVFSKKWAVEAGGYSTNIIGEDMELVVNIHRLIKEKKENKRIEFVPDPVCWTEAPQTLGVLRNQRRRWHQGLFESLWKHKKMTLNPRYGMIGFLSFPYFWLVECLGPLVELGGYIYIVIAFFLGKIYYEVALMLLLLFVIYGVIFSIAAILFESWSMNTYPKKRELLRMILLAFTEIFWYRPLTLFWRCEGLLRFVLRKSDWGNMKRVGIAEKEKSV